MLYCVIMVLGGVVSIDNTALGSASCCIDYLDHTSSYHYNAYSTRFRVLTIIYIYTLSIYMVTFNSEQVVFCCNCMTNSLWTSVYVALYGI